MRSGVRNQAYPQYPIEPTDLDATVLRNQSRTVALAGG